MHCAYRHDIYTDFVQMRTDTYLDVCTDMCMDMYRDRCRDRPTGMCVDMCVGMWVDMCVGMWVDMRVGMSDRSVHWHVGGTCVLACGWDMHVGMCTCVLACV